MGSAYLATSLIALVVLFALNRHGDATLLREVLAIHFIASLAAGLEPGTAKAAALTFGAGIGAPSSRAILVASGVKAVLASPVLATVWWLSDPAVDGRLLLFAPLICVAGFIATDVRVVFDLKGRHAAAIWIKQGGLGGGLIILALLAGVGATLPVALGVATAARLLLVLAVSGRMGSGGGRSLASQVAALLRDPRWFSLAGASIVAAVGGSADRALGLRYLSPLAWAAYYALYEILSKFWFIPYVVAPIIFARVVAGRNARDVARWGVLLTLGTGALFAGGLAVALLAAPDIPGLILGTRLSAYTPSFAIVAFATAIVINSLAQIRIAELQGRGFAHGMLAAMGSSAVATTALFYVAVRSFGAAGLMYAWLAKSIVELCLVQATLWRTGRRVPG